MSMVAWTKTGQQNSKKYATELKCAIRGTPPRTPRSLACWFVWPSGLGWGLARYGGAGTVALGSATISYGHVRDVLTAWHYNTLAAAVGPLVLDGLMVVCGFALLANSLTNTGDRRHHPATTHDQHRT
jgi:hypothetical protein